MVSFIFSCLTLLLLRAASADFGGPGLIIYIYVPEEVAADSPFEAKINVEQHNYETTYCSSFRVYLATHAKGEADPFFYHTDCYLLHEQTLCDPSIEIASDYIVYSNTSFTVTIPASVGPSGKHYVLKAQTLKTDGSYYGATLESNVFSITGSTGDWGQYQLQGLTLWGDDGIPCGAYDCVRKCASEAQHDYKNGMKTPNSTYVDCANDCPNVYIDPSSSYGGQPTTSLTTPSACSMHAPTVTFTSGVTGINPISTATRSRSVAAAAGTSAASQVVRFQASTSLAIFAFTLGVSIG